MPLTFEFLVINCNKFNTKSEKQFWQCLMGQFTHQQACWQQMGYTYLKEGQESLDRTSDKG